MGVDQNKAIARRYIMEFWGDRALDTADELLNPGFRFHSPMRDLEGREAVKQFVSAIHSVFSGIAFSIAELIAEDEKVAIHWRLSGKHAAEFMGIPATGRKIDLPGATIVHCRDGKLSEAWLHWDRMNLLDQLKAK